MKKIPFSLSLPHLPRFSFLKFTKLLPCLLRPSAFLLFSFNRYFFFLRFFLLGIKVNKLQLQPAILRDFLILLEKHRSRDAQCIFALSREYRPPRTPSRGTSPAAKNRDIRRGVRCACALARKTRARGGKLRGSAPAFRFSFGSATRP